MATRNFLSHLMLFLLCVLGNTNAYSISEPAKSIFDNFIWDEEIKLESFQTIVETQGYRILWWNIRNGLVSRKLPRSSLDENLRSFVQSSIRPDMMAFSEYSKRSLSAETQARLAEAYPYRHFQPYNLDNTTIGIAVYSNTKFEIEFLDYLDWTPPSLLSITEKNTYRNDWQPDIDFFTRPLFCLKIMKKGEPFYVLPVHLLDPWRILRRRKGTIFTAWEVMGGTDNPLWFQMGYMEDNLHQRFGDDLARSPFIIFGDFNTPEVTFLNTIGYRQLTKVLKDVIVGNPTTFPAKSSIDRKDFPELSLDHGFANSKLNVKVAEVLPLQGSNHYALYFILEK